MAADDTMHIKAVGADLTLGGEVFTARLVQHCLDELPAATGTEWDSVWCDWS
jgi:molecular chaperone DnaK (HSP70)